MCSFMVIGVFWPFMQIPDLKSTLVLMVIGTIVIIVALAIVFAEPEPYQSESQFDSWLVLFSAHNIILFSSAGPLMVTYIHFS